MIEALVEIIARFPGQKNRVRCFAHIINLVVKIILRQFDSRVKKTKGSSGELAEAIEQLEKTLDLDEMAMDIDEDEEGEGEDENEDVDDDAMDGVDEVEKALGERLSNMEAQSKPIKLILTKVSRTVTYSGLHGLIELDPQPRSLSATITTPPHITASKTVLCDQELADQSSTSMGGDSERTVKHVRGKGGRNQGSQVSSRHSHSLELYLRYARLCVRLSLGH